jgi:ribosomal protein L11 methyltransferase
MSPLLSVDWAEQWSLFAEGFRDGLAHIDLSRYGAPRTVRLYPGPGFGDLSHPTTRLMLDMMHTQVSGERILDIGSGSGILSLAALKLGAQSAIGIDIDEEALSHARKNGRLNNLKARFCREAPPSLQADHIVLMNMIFSEQKMVEPLQYNRLAKLWITSGILEEQRDRYLAQTEEWGWEFMSEHRCLGWLGFIFKKII